MQLLNTTVSSLAISTNKVLTAAYHACYDNASPGDELVLLTAPLASTAEVESLFTNGLIDIQSALPAALHSLGCTATEIEGAMKRRREADKAGGDSKLLEAQTAAQLGDADVALKAAQTLKTQQEVESVKAQTEKTKAEVGKVDADTKVSERQACAPHPSSEGSEGSGGAESGKK